jgi:hypothetical protein
MPCLYLDYVKEPLSQEERYPERGAFMLSTENLESLEKDVIEDRIMRMVETGSDRRECEVM